MPKSKSKTKTKITYPRGWNPKEGWPHDPNAKSPDGRTWGELDAELKKQGTSLDAVTRKMGGPQ